MYGYLVSILRVNTSQKTAVEETLPQSMEEQFVGGVDLQLRFYGTKLNLWILCLRITN